LQMLLDPSLLDKESRVIQIENLIKSTASATQVIMCIDPAGEKGGGDEHALCIGGLESGLPVGAPSRVHVICIEGSREPVEVFFRKAISLCRKHNVWKIKIESALSGYVSLLQKMISEVGGGIQVEGIKDMTNKSQRLIEILDPNLNAGRVSFEPVVLSDKATDLQFRTFTYKNLPKMDDRLDALAYLIHHFVESRQLNWGGGGNFESASLGSPTRLSGRADYR